MAKMTLQINIKAISKGLVWVSLVLFSMFSQEGLCSLATRESSVVNAVRQVTPAVVNISSQYEIRKNSNPFSGYGMDPMLEKFFRDFYAPEFERREKRTSLGSGVIIDGQRGFVLTNTHVVDKATTIAVTLNDKQEYEAVIVGMDPDSDLAVLKIQTDQKLPAIQMGNSDDIMIGEAVIAIGNPFGFSHTVTTGVVSAVNRSIRTSQRVFHEFIQTDASINPGNSGGPFLNIDGELIGINTAIYAEAQGIGFAIPINRAKRIVSDLINYGAVVQAWIGLTVQPIDANLSAYLNLQNSAGVIVTGVETESPASAAKLQEGDIIRFIDDFKIIGLSEYRSKLTQIAAGQTISIAVERNGKINKRTVQTAAYPVERALDLALRQLGIAVAELDNKIRTKYRIQESEGVLIVQMQRGSHLHRIGVRPGDIIRRIDADRVDRLADFKAAIVKYRNKHSVVLLVQREGHLYYINAIMKDERW